MLYRPPGTVVVSMPNWPVSPYWSMANADRPFSVPANPARAAEELFAAANASVPPRPTLIVPPPLTLDSDATSSAPLAGVLPLTVSV